MVVINHAVDPRNDPFLANQVTWTAGKCGEWSVGAVEGISNAVSVKGGLFTGVVLVLRSDGTVATWGWIYGAGGSFVFSQSMNFGGLHDVVAIASGDAEYAVESDGSLWVWGSNGHGLFGNGTSGNGYPWGTPLRVPGIPAVANVSTSFATIAVMKDGSVWSWGENWDGEANPDRVDLGRHKVPEQLMGGTGAIGSASGEANSFLIGAAPPSGL
jgi:hypothetical protein